MDEIWKSLEEFPNYEVSNLGNVRRTITVEVPSRKFNRKYRRINLIKDGITHQKFLHVVICMAFYGPKPSPGHEVAHGALGSHVHQADNVRWATRKENAADRVRDAMFGLTTSGRPKGSRNNITPEKYQLIAEVRRTPKTPLSIKMLAKKYKVSRPLIRDIYAGKRHYADLIVPDEYLL